MEKTAFIISLISLVISGISYKQKCHQVINVEKTNDRKGAVFFNVKKPEQVRIEKKLKQGEELNIEELC